MAIGGRGDKVALRPDDESSRIAPHPSPVEMTPQNWHHNFLWTFALLEAPQFPMASENIIGTLNFFVFP
jgi:hypothetical protein